MAKRIHKKGNTMAKPDQLGTGNGKSISILHREWSFIYNTLAKEHAV
jgi:hypothetical protein